MKQVTNGIYYLMATFAVIFSNYFFHLIAAKNLEAFDYGILSGLFALFGLFAFAGVSLQTKTTEISARIIAQKNTKELQETQKRWIKKTIYFSLFIALLFGLFNLQFAQHFHTDAKTIYAFLPIFCITLPLCVIRGFLQGQQNYKKLSYNFLLESLLKLGIAILAIFYEMGLPGILLGLSLSQIPSFIWGLKVLKKSPEATDLDILQKKELPQVPLKTMGIYFGLYAIWFNADLLILQHYLPEMAGPYSVASKLGQLILFTATNIGSFLFPRMIENFETQKSNKNNIVIGVSLIIGGGFLGILFLDFFKDFFVIQLFGDQYAQATKWIKYFGIFGIFIGLTHLGSQYLFAIGEKKFIWGLGLITCCMMFDFYLKLQKELNHEIFFTLIFWSLILALYPVLWKIKKICITPKKY